MICIDDSKPLRVVQVSDFHLGKGSDHALLGMNTGESLGLVLELVAKEQAEADLILATGDLSQDGSPESYESCRRHLDGFNMPVYWLPGNHDNKTVMDSFLAPEKRTPCVVDQGSWRFILLDSSIESEVEGYLPETQLSFLRESLQQSIGKHVMVFMHHPLVPIGSTWLDLHKVANAPEVFDIIRGYPHVRGAGWGHIHQAYERVVDGINLFSSPSTCVQFKPGSDNFTLDTNAPGYRWFDLYGNGEIATGISRISAGLEWDRAARGY